MATHNYVTLNKTDLSAELNCCRMCVAFQSIFGSRNGLWWTTLAFLPTQWIVSIRPQSLTKIVPVSPSIYFGSIGDRMADKSDAKLLLLVLDQTCFVRYESHFMSIALFWVP